MYKRVQCIYMNKTVVAVIVVILVIGGYIFWGQEKGMRGDTTQQSSGKKMAFSQFIKQGGTYKCTVNQSVDEKTTSGTIFIGKDMMRGTFQTQVAGKQMMTNILVRDGYTHMWSDDMPVAIKMPMMQNGVDTNAGASGSYAWNAEQIGDYDCAVWNADQATFSLPVGIQFVDPASMGNLYKR